MGEHESNAMWQLYAPEGVVIQSTFDRLCASFAPEAEHVYVGEVCYMNFRTAQPQTYGNTLSAAFNKGIEYEHERELRAVVVRPPAGWTSGTPPLEQLRDVHAKFQKIAVDLDALVAGVNIAPGTHVEERDRIVEILRKRGLEVPLSASVLDDRPTLI